MNLVKKKVIAAAALIVSGVGFASTADAATQFTAKANVVSVRSYINGAYFVTLSTSALKRGGTCTTVYKVVPGQVGEKTIIATILTAKTAGDQVELEIASPCAGWGAEITSVVVY